MLLQPLKLENRTENISKNSIKSTNPNSHLKRFLFENIGSHSSSQTPHVDVAGVLVPSTSFYKRRLHTYKLESDNCDFILSMNKDIEKMAQKIEWEDVIVKGHIDYENLVIDVVKITLCQKKDFKSAINFQLNSSDDMDFYEQAIAKRGVLEPELDDRAS